MKPLLKLLLTVLLAASAANAQWTFSPSGTATQFVDSGNVYDSFPVLIKASNGTILSFYRKGTSQVSDRGVIMLQSSTNNGATWNPIRRYELFGTDMADLFRHIAVKLEKHEDTRELVEGWSGAFTGLIDSLQLQIDNRKLSSEVHMLLRRRTSVRRRNTACGVNFAGPGIRRYRCSTRPTTPP